MVFLAEYLELYIKRDRGEAGSVFPDIQITSFSEPFGRRIAKTQKKIGAGDNDYLPQI